MHWGRWKRLGDPLKSLRPANGTTAAYYAETVVPYEGDECLIWPFAKNADGRAVMSTWPKPGMQLVHRRLCGDVHGEPPTPLHDAAHSCGKGNLGCVNKRHLRWATKSENEMDKVGHGTSNRGEQHGAHKLTEADVREIRAMRGREKQADLARRFGINNSLVSMIQTRKRWEWLED